jgi:spore coat protein U-like protein
MPERKPFFYGLLTIIAGMSICYRHTWQGLRLGACLLAWAPSIGPASAATTTNTFNVQIIIAAECTIQSAADLDFGSTGVLDTVVDATTTIDVQCTDTTPYNIGLDAGTGTGATVAARLMTGSGAPTVTYSLYQDSGHSTVWGETIGTDTVSGTGNGAVQSYTVYGRVPVQSTPAADTYTDVITVTVTY